jgi:hypothetical protein
MPPKFVEHAEEVLATRKRLRHCSRKMYYTRVAAPD